MENNTLDMLMSREQLMEDIIAIVDGELSGIISDRLSDELTTRLCDAVCKNFPTKWYLGQPLRSNRWTVHYRLQSSLKTAILTAWQNSTILAPLLLRLMKYSWTFITPTWQRWLRWDTIGQTVRWLPLPVVMLPIPVWFMVAPLTLNQSMMRQLQTISTDCDNLQGATQNRHSTQNPLL